MPHALVAQWIECSTPTRKVAGSNPVGCAKIVSMGIEQSFRRSDFFNGISNKLEIEGGFINEFSYTSNFSEKEEIDFPI